MTDILFLLVILIFFIQTITFMQMSNHFKRYTKVLKKLEVQDPEPAPAQTEVDHHDS